MPPPDFNFNTAIKLLFDGSLFGVNRHFITMAIRTGQNATVYAIDLSKPFPGVDLKP